MYSNQLILCQEFEIFSDANIKKNLQELFYEYPSGFILFVVINPTNYFDFLYIYDKVILQFTENASLFQIYYIGNSDYSIYLSNNINFFENGVIFSPFYITTGISPYFDTLVSKYPQLFSKYHPDNVYISAYHIIFKLFHRTWMRLKSNDISMFLSLQYEEDLFLIDEIQAKLFKNNVILTDYFISSINSRSLKLLKMVKPDLLYNTFFLYGNPVDDMCEVRKPINQTSSKNLPVVLVSYMSGKDYSHDKWIFLTVLSTFSTINSKVKDLFS